MNTYHRQDGKFGTHHEKEAYQYGQDVGTRRGIAIGVGMAAKAMRIAAFGLFSVNIGRRKVITTAARASARKIHRLENRPLLTKSVKKLAKLCQTKDGQGQSRTSGP